MNSRIDTRLVLLQSSTLLLSVVMAMAARASTDDDEVNEPTHHPGLVAELQQKDQRIHRIDEDLQFDWGPDRPDRRLDRGLFRASWSGFLLVTPPGDYQFDLWIRGRARVLIDGRVVAHGQSEGKRAVVVGTPVRLDFGYRPIVVEYEKIDGDAAIQIYWSSNAFDREPIPASKLLHLPDPLAEGQSRAEEQLTFLRCGACHDLNVPADRAQSLKLLNGAVSHQWLEDYLATSRDHHSQHPLDFNLSASDAKAVAHYVLSLSEPLSWSRPPKGDRHEGQQRFQQIGCLACHQVDGNANDASRPGGDLSQIATKRPPGYFLAWLTDPAKLNADHNMPTFDLAKDELRDISAYLRSLGEWSPVDDPHIEPELVEHGRHLTQQLRCRQCHTLDSQPADPLLPITDIQTNIGCLDRPDRDKLRPGYRLAEREIESIRTYIDQLVDSSEDHRDRTARAIILSNNCYGCHARGTEQGLRSIVASLGTTDPKEQAAMVPPSLESVGSKLRTDWLVKAVAGNAPRQRPWLAPRMPKFPMSSEQQNAITEFFQLHDALPPASALEPQIPHESMILAAGRLVGPAGFGCISCHSVGDHEPANVEPGARGPNLRDIENRIHWSWFRRWTRNPSRISPGVEMPAINLASPGLLDEKVETQLRALWLGLNDESLVVPTQNAVQSLTAIGAKQPIIFRDLFEHDPKNHTTRPFAIGFPNGHSVLIDLDRFTLRRWWFGDFATQHTRGKTWYWQTAGVALWDEAKRPPLIALYRDGRVDLPISSRQALAQIRSWQRTADNIVSAEIALQFTGEITIPLQLNLKSLPNGVQISVTVLEPPPEAAQVVFLQPTSERFQTDLGPVRVSLTPNRRLDAPSPAPAFVVNHQIDYNLEWSQPVEPVSAIKSLSPFKPPAKDLPVLPGYQVTRLSMPAEPMPIGMACRSDGAIVVTSLKGGVYLARDSDGDGELDSYIPYSDVLAAPFGVYVEEDNVLVAHKHELLRLHDNDQDDFCERADVVATGWGVTFDYHDWAVGPVPDGNGNYFLALSCQQDKRTTEQALGRGKLIRTRPDGGFEIDAHGLRFPMGLARSADGELFATDNQGVTNPFNELNHLRPGRHYGFFNKLESRQPDQPTESAAIQIPHPWSGSVNGIAFVPPGDDFGPFAGHLIGAEYTTRRLIRMSLQQVGDSFQGCVYPFGEADKEAIERDTTFLGPMALAFDASGNLYVGSIIDSGWGGGNNRGAIERVRRSGRLPFGIREVRAWSNGFDIEFTAPADPALASDANHYKFSSYRRVHTSGYATPDQDRQPETVVSVELSPDKKTAHVRLQRMRTGFVYDIAIDAIAPGDESTYPAVAYYTLNAIP